MILSSKKGLTLLEILVAVTLFSIMTIFLTQIVRTSLRQREKISGGIKNQRTISNTLDVMNYDFNGVVTFFDFNTNLQQMYPIQKIKEERDEKNQKTLPTLINPEFDFLGTDQEVKMTTFSLVESEKGEMIYQTIRVQYSLGECSFLKTGEKTQCLFRNLIQFRDDSEIQKKYILLRGVKSFQLHYQGLKGGEFDEEWKKEWKIYQKDLSNMKNLPAAIKMDVEWGAEKQKQKSFIFSISHSLFRNQGPQLQKIFAFLSGHEKSKEETQIQNNWRNNPEDSLDDTKKDPSPDSNPHKLFSPGSIPKLTTDQVEMLKQMGHPIPNKNKQKEQSPRENENER